MSVSPYPFKSIGDKCKTLHILVIFDADSKTLFETVESYYKEDLEEIIQYDLIPSRIKYYLAYRLISLTPRHVFKIKYTPSIANSVIGSELSS